MCVRALVLSSLEEVVSHLYKAVCAARRGRSVLWGKEETSSPPRLHTPLESRALGLQSIAHRVGRSPLAVQCTLRLEELGNRNHRR